MLFGASFVDSSEDVEELSSDWGVAGVRDSGEILSEGLCVSMDGSIEKVAFELLVGWAVDCLLYTSPSPRDRTRSRMPSSA